MFRSYGKPQRRTYDKDWISVKERRKIYRRDNFQCVYCDSTYMLQLDHVRPRSRGGTDDASNLVTACRTCNLAKGARMIPGRTTQMKVANYRKERLRITGKRGGKRRNRASSVPPTNKDGERRRGCSTWLIAIAVILIFSLIVSSLS